MFWRFKKDFDGSILFVDCTGRANTTIPERSEIGRMSLFARTLDETKVFLSLGVVDGVVAVIDPLEEDTIERSSNIVRLAKEAGTPIASMASFNPIWIENLTEQLGFVTHFRKTPSPEEIDLFAANRDGQTGHFLA